MEELRIGSWFASLCLCLAAITAAIAVAPPDLSAGIVPSRVPGAANSRNADLDLIQRALEQEVVRQKLVDYGVSLEAAMDKIRQLDDRELHLLATKTEGIAEGGSMVGVSSGGAALIVAVLIAISLVIYFLVMGAKAVVTDMRNKPPPEKLSPEPVPSPAPAR